MITCGTAASNLKCVKCKDCFNRIYEEQIRDLKSEKTKLFINKLEVELKNKTINEKVKIAKQLLNDHIEILERTYPDYLLTIKMLKGIVQLLGDEQ